MNLTDVTARRNYIKKAEKNIVIPWDDPYPNISDTLSEEQQLLIKTLRNLVSQEMKNYHKQMERAPSSSSTNKSIKFLDNELICDNGNRPNSEVQPSGILKSRSSTKLSGLYNYYLKFIKRIIN